MGHTLHAYYFRENRKTEIKKKVLTRTTLNRIKSNKHNEKNNPVFVTKWYAISSYRIRMKQFFDKIVFNLSKLLWSPQNNSFKQPNL